MNARDRYDEEVHKSCELLYTAFMTLNDAYETLHRISASTTDFIRDMINEKRATNDETYIAMADKIMPFAVATNREADIMRDMNIRIAKTFQHYCMGTVRGVETQ